ncbi:ABC transporter permease [Lusitaniella coriacea LEGE 07157]|uniref:ABC transporter permease n=1 Tax=Lusitaniella coriacea LEGE 07157 TaxID=945747 RepID=A0A8J7B6W6_9CYAN|nr:ABC transporter permease [Lusitaniella coriacea]MBE9114676.1 ABC transporter permease [Lusitaniella coriacea LEGE 07157]
MLATVIDGIGEWNPQFYREVKGRLKTRNLIYTAIVSFSVQSLCILFNSRNSHLNEWSVKFNSLFSTLDWLVPLVLLVFGTYLISRDLFREQKRGTLGFLRLSPQTSESLVLGKLLGVPILLYLWATLAIPLHFYAGLKAEISWTSILSTYVLWGTFCVLFYLMSVLLILNAQKSKTLSGSQEWASSLLALICAPMCISVSTWIHQISWTWFFLPLSNEGILTYLWLLGTVWAVNFGIWNLINRHFHNTRLALLSKRQSYWVVAMTQLWLLGFFVHAFINSGGNDLQEGGVFLLLVFAPIEISLLSLCLLPNRQSLLDWARYRHQEKKSKRNIVRDLLLREKSPTIGAIALNIGIILILWLPWVLSTSYYDDIEFSERGMRQLILLSALHITNLLLIYSAIAHLVSFHAKTAKQETSLLWLVPTLLPLIIAILFRLEPAKLSLLWLLSPVPIFGVLYASTPILLLGFLGQFCFLGLLLRQLQLTLKQAGESESKRLLAGETG